MPELSQLMTFVAASVLLTLTPGPDIIYVIMRGAVQGPKAGLAAAAGLSIGVLGHTAFCVIGLTALLAASSLAFTAVKWIGAAYLVYLGVRMWMAGNALDFSMENKGKSLFGIFRQTVLMNLINPKVALFFLAFLPQFVDPASGPVQLQFAVFGLVFMGVAFVVMGLAGMMGGHVRRFLITNENGSRRAHQIAGTVLVGLGLSLLVEGQD